MTTTDALKVAVAKALEQHRPQLDAGLPLVSVSLIVRLDRKTGRPRELLFRTEDQSDVRCGVPPIS